MSAGVLALGLSVTLLSAMVDVPQVTRTLRTRDTTGLSFATTLAWTAGWVFWGYYAVSVHDVPAAAAALVGLAVQACLTVLVARSQLESAATTPARLARSAWWLAGYSLVALTWWQWGPAPALVALACVDVATMLPQLRATFAASGTAGVAVGTAWLRLIVYLGWIAYMLAVGDVLLVAYAWALAPIAAAILARVQWQRRGR